MKPKSTIKPLSPLVVALLVGLSGYALSCDLKPLVLKKMANESRMTAVSGKQTFNFVFDAKAGAYIPMFKDGPKTTCQGKGTFGDPFSEQATLWYDRDQNAVMSYAQYGTGEVELFFLDTRTCSVREKLECQGDVTITKDRIHCSKWCEMAGGKKDCSPEHNYKLDQSCRVKQ